jgi:hypothetical protein
MRHPGRVFACVFSWTLLCLCCVGFLVPWADGEEAASRPAGKGNAPGLTTTKVPSYPGNIVLGRPTDRSVTASILLQRQVRARIVYGPGGKGLEARTEEFDLPAGVPREIVIEGLAPNSSYEYRIVDAATGQALLPIENNGSFRTAPDAGSKFVFAVQADSHLDSATDLDLYRRTLGNIRADGADFLIDLGDTFMTDKYRDRESATRQYAAQRYWLGLVGDVAPVYLALGNHDGEEAFRPNADGADGLAVWANAQRKRLFPNPVPSPFYTGSAAAHPQAGALQDYYAWTWGDALFVVLDPYWYSTSTRGGREPWNMTLGKTQYEWLARTLRTSQARLKFVFIHQLVGGVDANGRGGIEAATLYEWGGRNADGKDEFAAKRPGWEAPVHRLLVENGVQIVFHGHDHFFAKQELDGVVYQLVPQPARRDYQGDHAAEYGYRTGEFVPGAGHLRVRISPEEVTVEFVLSCLPADENTRRKNGGTAYAYTLRPRPYVLRTADQGQKRRT